MGAEAVVGIVISIITVLVAILALLQTNRQVVLSNKQRLFDRRIEKYLLLQELLALYCSGRCVLKKNSFADVDTPFGCLTNCARLETVYAIIKRPDDNQLRILFLKKCEELEHAATEMQLIWDKKLGELPSLFVKQYVQLLKALFVKQNKFFMLEQDKTKRAMSLEEVQEELKQSIESGGLISAFDEIENTYHKIEKQQLVEKLAQSIKLVK